MASWRCAIVAICLVASGAAAGQQRPPMTAEEREAAQAAVARFTSPRLTRFADEAEFRAYVDALRAAGRASWSEAGPGGRIRFAQAQPQAGQQSDTADPLCPEDDPECRRPTEPGGADERVMVTGSRVTPRNPSITNNQIVGIEEGDIVKQIDHFLLVLQDGRLFVIDIEARRGRRLALTDRVDIYRDRESDTWYDEMLVFEDRIIVLGYSYDDSASELAVFRLEPTGRLRNEGIFHISSNDYYSTGNYASRLVGDSLVIYTPVDIAALDSEYSLPLIRRWMPDEARDPARRRGKPIIDARDIYRPVRETHRPTIHAVSVCPLGPVSPAADLECRTSGFVGPPATTWYVTADHVFLWSEVRPSWIEGDKRCDPYPAFTPSAANPSLLHRIAVADGTAAVAATRGVPPDQFSLDASGGQFHALLQWRDLECVHDYEGTAQLVYLDIAADILSDTLAELPERAYAALPPTGSQWNVNRFTRDYLVYGALSPYRRQIPDIDRLERDGEDEDYIRRIRDALARQTAYVLPIDRPDRVRPIEVGHTMIRAEQAGNDVVLTGYRDRSGLVVTLIDLDRTPRIASSVRLDGRYESEGRSHAFNSLIEPAGAGLMGLPTVPRLSESRREWWRSSASDVSFLQVDRRGQLVPVGELRRRFDYADDEDDGFWDEDGIPGYRCEVSCVDWYGNSRPIFTDGRIFGLAGTELIEGWIEGGLIRENQRLNIALESVRLAATGSD